MPTVVGLTVLYVYLRPMSGLVISLVAFGLQSALRLPECHIQRPKRDISFKFLPIVTHIPIPSIIQFSHEIDHTLKTCSPNPSKGTTLDY